MLVPAPAPKGAPRPLDCGALLEHLGEELGQAGPGVLAFDGDGTLWDAELGPAFVSETLRARRLRPDALAGLQSVARANVLPVVDEVHAQAEILVRAHTARSLSPMDAYAIGASMLAGLSEDEAEAWAETVLEKLDLGTCIRSGIARLLAWARSREVEVFVVSPAPHPVVVAAAARLGLAREEVVATRAQAFDGVLASQLAGPVPHGAGKLIALRRVRPKLALLAAFGDDTGDLELLRAARLPVAVCPTDRLLKRAGEIPGLRQWDGCT